MARLKPLPVALDEAVEVTYLGPEARDEQLALLESPWVADEGPVDARLKHWTGEGEAPLPRGLAFDRSTTVVWDEDAVQLVKPAPSREDVVANAQPVLLRRRLEGPKFLTRVDYLRRGVWLASRYLAVPVDQLGRT